MEKRKRNAGEGLLRQRKDGRWEGRIVIGYDDKNLPITKNVTSKSKTECERKSYPECAFLSGRRRKIYGR